MAHIWQKIGLHDTDFPQNSLLKPLGLSILVYLLEGESQSILDPSLRPPQESVPLIVDDMVARTLLHDAAH
jgi:hypothetical protein